MLASYLKRRVFSCCVSTLLLTALMVGCGQKATSDYVPETNQARQALERMLEAWRAGEVSDASVQLPDGGPKVQVFDKERAAGKKLLAAEVLKEIVGKPEDPRQFSVKLKIEGQDKEIETAYYVVGIDPLLIFRESEYKQASGMN